MAYVALSRVRSLSGLYLAAFDPKSIMVSHSCLKEVNRLRETYRNNLPQYPVPLQTRTGTKRKLTGSTQDDQPKAKKNKKTPKAPPKPVPRNRKRRASSKLEDEKPDKKKKKRGSGGHGGEPGQTSWRYHPVDVEWQHNACNVMGLQFHGPNTVA